MINYIPLTYHILYGGGVILHYQGRCSPVLVIYDEFYLIFITGRFEVVADYLSDGLLVLLVGVVELVFIKHTDVVVGFMVVWSV